jgi:hypothetical protein
MPGFLTRPHPILPGERCTRWQWGQVLQRQREIIARLRAEGVIDYNTDGEIVRVAVLEKYREMYGGGDRQGGEADG